MYSARAKQVDTNCDCGRCIFSDFRAALGVRAAAQQRRDVETVNLFMQVGDAAPGAARVQRELMGKERRCYGTAADVPWRYNEGSPASL